MKKSFFYLGNITGGAIYYCNDDRNIYLFPPQTTETAEKTKRSIDLSPLFSAAGIFGYLLMRGLTHTVTTHYSALFIFLYCFFSAIGGLGIAFMFIGFIRRRTRKNSSSFVLLEKISEDDYMLIRNKARKQLPFIYIFSALLLYVVITEPMSWQDYTDVFIFFTYFVVWAALAVIIYLFSPFHWFRSMKALRRIRNE
ncbi:MAG: hypothetical protein ACOYJI_08085 [Anaerovoracaceae bacterium]|jgi:hypothetical protein